MLVTLLNNLQARVAAGKGPEARVGEKAENHWSHPLEGKF